MTRADGGQAPQDGDSPAPHCYRHPNREALVRCTRCDRPICPDCMRPASVGFHCPDDVALAAKEQRAPRTTFGAQLRQSPPYVTAALVAANVAVFLVTGAQSTQGFGHPSAAPLFTDWQLFPLYVYDKSQYYRLFTSAFLHVSVLHIGSNMLALIIIGPLLERVLGRWRFATVYLLGALGGSAAIYLFGSHLQPVVGASGAIFGLFAAALLMARRIGLDVQWLVAVIVLNFVFTFSVADVSKLGHVGGFLAGAAAAVAIGGLPNQRGILPLRAQLVGLGAIAATVLALVVAGTATF